MGVVSKVSSGTMITPENREDTDIDRLERVKAKLCHELIAEIISGK